MRNTQKSFMFVTNQQFSSYHYEKESVFVFYPSYPVWYALTMKK